MRSFAHLLLVGVVLFPAAQAQQPYPFPRPVPPPAPQPAGSLHMDWTWNYFGPTSIYRALDSTTCVFRDSAFADDVSKTKMAAILEQHGLGTVRSL